MAMTMLQTLYDATGGRLEWCGIDLVLSQPEHGEALEYAIGQHWIEASPEFESARLIAEGRRSSHSTAGGPVNSGRGHSLRAGGD